MINKSQQELLDSLIGENGIYIETIMEDKHINQGTKILYLERAITQDCETYLNSLDLLYHPAGNSLNIFRKKRPENIEVIRSLKFINDFCFNNQVQFAEFGPRNTLDHFFGKLGLVDGDDFQTAVRSVIVKKIEALQADHPDEITAQKSAREKFESTATKQISWRAKINPPSESKDDDDAMNERLRRAGLE